MILIEWFLVALMWCLALTALLSVVALLLSYRRPPEPAPLVPDYVPEDWGGDRPQANPERDPAIERGIQDRRR